MADLPRYTHRTVKMSPAACEQQLRVRRVIRKQSEAQARALEKISAKQTTVMSSALAAVK